MCVGGGGGVSEAVITNPLAPSAERKKAQERIQQIKARKGDMSPGKYQRKLDKAREAKRNAPKYADKNANKVDESSRFALDVVKGLLDEGNPLNQLQELANASQQGVQQTLTNLNQLASLAAENQQLMQQDAMRMSALIGPPPPEESAKAPVIGANRFDGPRPGRTRRDLRIDKAPAGDLTIY